MIWAIWRERGNYGISPVIILWSRRRLKAHLIVKSNSIIKIIVNCVSNLNTAAEEKRREEKANGYGHTPKGKRQTSGQPEDRDIRVSVRTFPSVASDGCSFVRSS